MTVTTEAEFLALPVFTVLRDRNGDVFEKVTPNGMEMTGTSGTWGATWVAYPATVLYSPLT